MRYPLLLAFIFYLLLTIFAQQIPYFWDNVALVSNPAQFYYNTQFKTLILPLLLDTGHPPFYGYYIARCWQFFGKDIAVSHWANLPFLIGIAWAYVGLCRYFLALDGQKTTNYLLFFCVLLLLTEPSLLTQSVLATPDVALVCGMLVALYGIVQQRTIVLSLGLCLMTAVSLRGLIQVPAIFLCHLVSLYFNKKHTLNFAQENTTIPLFLQKNAFFLAYIPVAFLLIIWLVYHHQQAGFWLENYHANWAVNYGTPTAKRFLLNWCIVAWRFLDQGRVFIWLIIGWIGLKNSAFAWLSAPQKQLIVWILVWLMISGLPVSFREIPIMHRYYIVHYLLIGLLAISLLPTLKLKKQYLTFAFVLLAQITGHFWIYPQPISTDWDSTLASMPYFSLKKACDKYLQDQKIPQTAVASKFPLINSTQQTHLTADTTHLQYIADNQLEQYRYVLYSNLSNDFTATEIAYLQANYLPQKRWTNGCVQLVLYRQK